MRRVPVVVAGTGSLADRFRALVDAVTVDLAGFEGFALEVAGTLGREPSVLVDTGGGYDAAVAAVHAGHAAATADLAALVADPVTFAVLRADHRIGLRAALLPGLPLVETLYRCRDAADPVAAVTLTGPDREALADEAVAVAALTGIELRRADVRTTKDDHGGTWQATVSDRFPTVEPAEYGDLTRTAVVRSQRGEVTLRGPVGGDDRTADALLADVLTFAREGDRPWRVHRRQAYR